MLNKLPMGIKEKALSLNFDDSIYGSFAEIGAGQEVARHFFQAGGASNTVAKTMSAYDMVFSDEIYGREKSGRYVCEKRLEKMLSHEYEIIETRLGQVRGGVSRFFTFANTVATSSYGRGQNGHGWVGVRFQRNFGEKPSDFILHVQMKDNHALSQQQALGILGVNLIYGVFNYLETPKKLLDSLYDHLEKNRLSIDLVKVHGSLAREYKIRELNLHLVREGMTSAIMFDEKGQVVLPSDHIYKKDILLIRGSYRPPTLVNKDIIDQAQRDFDQDLRSRFNPSPRGRAVVCELSIKNPHDELLQENHFSERVDAINALGHKVLLTNLKGYYRLASFISSLTKARIGLVLGAYNFLQIFKQADGKLLESLGALFKENIEVYIYPYREKGEFFGLNSLGLDDKGQGIVDFLKTTGQLSELKNYNDEILHIFSRQVYDMIQKSEKGWEKLVPKEVVKVIQEKKLFGLGTKK